MGSTLWMVKVSKLSGREVVLQIRCVHPDAGFISARTFAFRLLTDTAWTRDKDGHNIAQGPLGNEMSFEDALDEAWTNDNAHHFVESVEIIGSKAAAKGEPRMNEVFSYQITATDARWLQHLHEGQEWPSTAY